MDLFFFFLHEEQDTMRGQSVKIVSYGTGTSCLALF